MDAPAADDRVEVERDSHHVDRAPDGVSRSSRTSSGGTSTVGG